MSHSGRLCFPDQLPALSAAKEWKAQMRSYCSLTWVHGEFCPIEIHRFGNIRHRRVFIGRISPPAARLCRYRTAHVQLS